MADNRSKNSRQIWITRSHLAALGVTTFLIATLAFLVGMQLGQTNNGTAPDDTLASNSPTPLVPDAAEEEALEALLREVEYAQSTLAPTGELVTEPAGLDFPVALEEDASRLGTDIVIGNAIETTVEPGPNVNIETPDPTAVDAPSAPSSGWAVQVAAYPNANEADTQVTGLVAMDIPAYRVAALVDGRTWYRVRIGGYETEEQALVGRNELRVRLGQPELLIASAP